MEGLDVGHAGRQDQIRVTLHRDRVAFSAQAHYAASRERVEYMRETSGAAAAEFGYHGATQ
jgi:hypothetical protein